MKMKKDKTEDWLLLAFTMQQQAKHYLSSNVQADSLSAHTLAVWVLAGALSGAMTTTTSQKQQGMCPSHTARSKNTPDHSRVAIFVGFDFPRRMGRLEIGQVAQTASRRLLLLFFLVLFSNALSPMSLLPLSLSLRNVL